MFIYNEIYCITVSLIVSSHAPSVCGCISSSMAKRSFPKRVKETIREALRSSNSARVFECLVSVYLRSSQCYVTRIRVTNRETVARTLKETLLGVEFCLRCMNCLMNG